MKRLLFILILASAALMSACQPSAQGAAQPTAVPTSPSFPSGKFVNTRDSNHEYRFKDDLTWSYYLGGMMGAKGSYHVSGNQWVEEGTDECPFEGVYTWSFDGSQLSFAVVGDDKCAPRKEATDGQTFSLVK
jgi:hypothetical protein